MRPLATVGTAAVALLALAAPSSAFYLPGAAPRDYAQGDKVEVFVNSLTPTLNTTLKSLVSYDYYDERLGFCQPEGGPIRQPENLGSILFGDRILSSAFNISMLNNETCVSLCRKKVSPSIGKFLNDRIKEDYGLNLIIDGLPSSEMKKDLKTGEIFLDASGFALGKTSDDGKQLVFNNHYDIWIQYHKRAENKFRVVGVMVYPRSVGNDGSGTPHCYIKGKPQYLSEERDTDLWYTYTVSFVENDTPWGLRWDSYLHVYNPKIHWFSLINSIVVVGFLCFMVSVVLYRAVSKDISRYNQIDLAEDVQEDYGWKLVHGEVFRSPERPMLLSVATGNGMHLVGMCAVTLVFAVFGLLSPSNRGSLATVLLILWCLFGCISGYVSARVFLSLGGSDWKANLALTAGLFPTVVFTFIGMLNFLLIFAGASGAVPFGTILAVLLLWFLITVPLTVAGYFFGMKHGGYSYPVRVSSIPRQIPPQPWYLRPIPFAILGGILPFGAAFVELYFMLSSLFGNRAYYAFGFLFLTFIVYAITTATVTVLFVYFILCGEEYRWHWRAFLIGGGSSFWIFIYGLWYWGSRLSFGTATSVMLYLGYLFLFALLNFLIGGAIGFIAVFFAVRTLYSSIRVD